MARSTRLGDVWEVTANPNAARADRRLRFARILISGVTWSRTWVTARRTTTTHQAIGCLRRRAELLRLVERHTGRPYGDRYDVGVPTAGPRPLDEPSLIRGSANEEETRNLNITYPMSDTMRVN